MFTSFDAKGFCSVSVRVLAKRNLASVSLASVFSEWRASSKKEDRDELSQWADQPEVTEALLLSEESVPDLVQRVTYGGYTTNPNDEEIMKMGADPLLISYALTDIENRTIVTVETSKPSRQGANKHIPDVCGALGVRCIDTFKLLNELDFRTDWEFQQ